MSDETRRIIGDAIVGETLHRIRCLPEALLHGLHRHIPNIRIANPGIGNGGNASLFA